MGDRGPGGPEGPAIEFREVALRLGGEPILRRLDFQVRRGEFLSLLGPTGCGKSTCLRLIGGLLEGYEGTVRVEGRPPGVAWERLAFVFQSPRLVPWKTAVGNVVLGMRLRSGGGPAGEMEGRAQGYLEMVGLGRDLQKYPSVLSGGERQRVALARALALEPDIILMDEPFSALDIQTRERLREEVIRIWQNTGKTILFVTHDLDEALALADTILVLSPKPTVVVKAVTLPQPRPRDLRGDGGLDRLRRELRSSFGGILDEGEGRRPAARAGDGGEP